MRQLNIIILLLCLPLAINAQTLNGKIYDASGTVKNIKVYNETQNRVTATNEKGDFNIIAKVNDTILFESIFYHPKAVVLNETHFKDIYVFELKKILNELDEVEVKAEPEQPVFEVETYNIELKNLIAEDIKNNPELYKPASATYGLDFVYVFRKLFDLIKSKKPKKPEETAITYEQFTALIEKSSLFNSDLITKDLKIPEENKYLFLEFCAAKQINSILLHEENKMELLEELVLNSQLFLILLEQYGKESIKN